MEKWEIHLPIKMHFLCCRATGNVGNILKRQKIFLCETKNRKQSIPIESFYRKCMSIADNIMCHQCRQIGRNSYHNTIAMMAFGNGKAHNLSNLMTMHCGHKLKKHDSIINISTYSAYSNLEINSHI